MNRALHHLQQQQVAEGSTPTHGDRDAREMRLARISRQKVCMLCADYAFHMDNFSVFMGMLTVAAQ